MARTTGLRTGLYGEVHLLHHEEDAAHLTFRINGARPGTNSTLPCVEYRPPGAIPVHFERKQVRVGNGRLLLKIYGGSGVAQRENEGSWKGFPG